MISFKNIHKMNNRAMPEAIMHYKHAIQLFKIYNSNEFTFNWLLLNFNQIFNSRQTTFKAFKSNNAKVGLNLLANRLTILNGKIPFSWLNESITLFKLKCKKLFLMDWPVHNCIKNKLDHFWQRLSYGDLYIQTFILLLIMNVTYVR